MKTVKELQGTLNLKRDELAAIFEKAKTKVDGEDRYNLTPEQLEDVKARNAEIDGIAKELEDAKLVDSVYQANAKAIKEGNQPASQLPLGGNQGEQPSKNAKSLGEMFTDSPEFKSRERGQRIEVNFKGLNMKTLMTTVDAAGFHPESIRTGKVVPYAVRRPVVADMIPQTPWDEAAVIYMEETTFTNNAATVAEAGLKPESALAWTQRTEALYKIAHWLPVTEEQLKYVPGVRAIIDNRLTLMLKLAEEVKLLTATGGGVDIDGFLHKTGVQSQAKGADPTPDAIYKAMTLVRYPGFAEPSGLIIHPNDWQDIRLLRTTDGIYIWGSPADAGAERIWGLPAVITTAETENTALLGDFQLYSEIFRSGNVNIKATDSHADYFIYNKWVIMAEEYLALAIYRPTAFAKVTGI